MSLWPDAFAWRMAWRDVRAHPGRQVVYAASVAFGVAALVAIMSLRADLNAAIDRHARALLGADLLVSSRRPLPRGAQDVMARLPAETARELSFQSMAYLPRADEARLVQVRAVERDFPFYGQLETDPAEAAAVLAEDDGALVEESILRQFGAEVGDRIRLGEAEFRVAGALKKVPGELPVESLIAPRVFIPFDRVEATGLIQPGSVVNYRTYLKFVGPVDSEQARNELRAFNVQVETVARRKANLVGSTDDFAKYMALVGFVALLMGCIGVAGALHAYAQQKRRVVALLRCLGATVRAVTTIFLIQALALAVAGAAAGAALGLAVERWLPHLLRNFLPVAVTPVVRSGVILQGVGSGMFFAVLFAWLPLLEVRGMMPLRVFRSGIEPAAPWFRDGARLLVLLMMGAGVALYAVAQAGSWKAGLFFSAGLGVFYLLLVSLSAALRWAAKRVAALGPYTWRQGLANLYRPNNQTLLMLVAIGLGTALATTIQLSGATLQKRLSLATDAAQPNLVMIDIQSSQAGQASNLARAVDLPVLHLLPIVAMRIESLGGLRANQVQDGESRKVPDWALAREYRATYRDFTTPTETVVEGRWHNGPFRGQGPVPISMEQSIAETLGARPGETIVFDVQGLALTTVVQSIRRVDWQTMQPNFYVVFPTGVLEQAPQTRALFTRAPSADRVAALQRAVVRQLPNVTVLDLAMIMDAVHSMISQIGGALGYLNLFVIGAGVLVIAGALRAGRYRRMEEMALLRALGASGRQARAIFMTEYAMLGLLGALSGIALAWAASWLLAKYFFKAPLVWSAWAMLLAAVVVVLVTLAISWLNERIFSKKTASDILRQVE